MAGGGARRQALMNVFEQFLDNIDDKCAVKGPPGCPATPRDTYGGGRSYGNGGGYGGVSQTAAPSGTSYTTPRIADYLDPAKRPLITFPDKEVQSRKFDDKPDPYYQVFHEQSDRLDNSIIVTCTLNFTMKS